MIKWKKCTYLHEQNKNPIVFMSIKEKEGKKGSENTQTDLQIINHEIIRDSEEPVINTLNKETESHNLIFYHVCVVLSFTESEANQWNSRIVFNIFLCFLFFIIFGIKIKPTSITVWREKLGKQGGKSSKIRTCSDIYCLFWGTGASTMCYLNKTGTN